MKLIGRRLHDRRIRLVLNFVALLSSIVMLAALLPSVRVPSLVQILYYLLVPGYALIRIVDHPFGVLDGLAIVVMVSFGLLVGLTAFFQTFFPGSGVNQSLFIPLIAIAASSLSFRASLVKKS
ncbi:MAG: hypothetical protein ABSB26_09015 [Nitrososphaerales archaeon]